MQKVNDMLVLDAFKDELKRQQSRMQGKRLQKGVDYVEAPHKAPFDISPDHMMVMSNEKREYFDKKITELQKRRLSPETLWRVEEERSIQTF